MTEYEKAIIARNAVIGMFAIVLASIFRPSLAPLMGAELSVHSEAGPSTLSHGLTQTMDAKNHAVLQTPTSASVEPIKGIDVSHFQGQIDWDELASSDIEFAYIKATEGQYYVDPKFHANRSGAQTSGVTYGSYHFFHPDENALAQANHFLKTVGPINQLPPVIDIEVTNNQTPEKIKQGVKIWLDQVEQSTGCKPIIYTNHYFWDENLDQSFSSYPLWIADYAKAPTLPPGVSDWVFWQYSEQGHQQGIPNPVDLDRLATQVPTLESIFCGGDS